MNTGTANKKNNILNSVKNKFGLANTNNTNNKNNLSNVKQNLNHINFDSPDKATKRKHIELDLPKKDEVISLLNFIKSGHTDAHLSHLGITIEIVVYT